MARLHFLTLGLIFVVACSRSPGSSSPASGATPSAPARAAPDLEVRIAQDPVGTPEELRRVLQTAQAAMRAFAEHLGPSRMPSGVLTIRLAGDARDGQVPTVDPETGEVVLYRQLGPGGEYEASVAHELMHAIRWTLWKEPRRQTSPFLFVEEGFAEIMAREAGFASSGFPTYGVEIDIAAGTWMVENQALPISRLVTKHPRLNFECMPQAYTLRLSFMLFAQERVGLESITQLAFSDSPISVATIEDALGAPLDVLATQWQEWAIDRYRSHPDAAAKAHRYRTQTPIRFFDVCDPSA